MRALVLMVLASTLLAGCAGEPEAPPRTLPLLRLVVDLGHNTTFSLGSVLGSEEGMHIPAFRFDDKAKTLLADIPGEATHLYLVNRTGTPATLVADATRATASRPDSQRPAIIQFEPRGNDFALDVVQPAECGAIVNNRGSVTNGTGPFKVPALRALPPGSREFVVFVLTGEGGRDCAAAKVEAENLGQWTILAPPRRD